MSYDLIGWVNDESALSAENFNHMEEGIKKANDLADKNASDIAEFAKEQIPEEYVKKSVDAYISENQAGLAKKEDVEEATNQLSSEIVELNTTFSNEVENINSTLNVRISSEVSRSTNEDNLLKERTNTLEEQINTLNEGGLNLKEDLIGQQVQGWLDKHPEATTTVQDNSLEVVKFTDETKKHIVKDYVTPQMFGAKADGTTDDTIAIQNAIDYVVSNGGVLFIPAGLYITSSQLEISGAINIVGASKNFGWATFDYTKPDCSVIYYKYPQAYTSALKVTSNAFVNIDSVNFMSNCFEFSRVNGYEPLTLKFEGKATVENVNGIDCSMASAFSTLKNVSVFKFSGVGIILGAVTENYNITSVYCNEGIYSATDCMITLFKIQGCNYGMKLATAIIANNGRIEEITYNGLYVDGNETQAPLTISDCFLDQIGYSAIGAINGGQLRRSTFNVEIFRCCAYYSGYGVSEIDSNFLPIASGKIASDETSLITDIVVNDNCSLDMGIDDTSGNIKVSPHVYSCQGASGNLYYSAPLFDHISNVSKLLKCGSRANNQFFVDTFTGKTLSVNVNRVGLNDDLTIAFSNVNSKITLDGTVGNGIGYEQHGKTITLNCVFKPTADIKTTLTNVFTDLPIPFSNVIMPIYDASANIVGSALIGRGVSTLTFINCQMTSGTRYSFSGSYICNSF